VDVHRIFDILRENSIGCESNLTTTTNYTRPTRLLYCVSRLSEVVSYIILVYGLTCLKLRTRRAIF